MAIKVNIRRVFFIVLWCLIGVGIVVLLGAAMRYRNQKTCQGYKIELAGGSGKEAALFVDKKEILNLLSAAGAGKWQDKPIASFDLHRMETVLEKDPWIRDAQLFFDNNGVLRVNVIEREPIARVFLQDGTSCYLDSSGATLPLSDRRTARLPVFTGYPAAKVRLHGPDSTLAVQVRQLGEYIRTNPFWMAQIDQVSIKGDRNFELIPTVGSHLVEFGDGTDYEQKFHRLLTFYKEVLSRTGMDKYSRIDVEYDGQVVATRKGTEVGSVDSLQGMKNIQQLIRSARQMGTDTAQLQQTRPLEQNTVTEQSLTNYDLIPGAGDSTGTHTTAPTANPATRPGTAVSHGTTAHPAVNHPGTGAKPAATGNHAAAINKPKPRAVMPRKR